MGKDKSWRSEVPFLFMARFFPCRLHHNGCCFQHELVEVQEDCTEFKCILKAKYKSILIRTATLWSLWIKIVSWWIIPSSVNVIIERLCITEQWHYSFQHSSNSFTGKSTVFWACSLSNITCVFIFRSVARLSSV